MTANRPTEVLELTVALDYGQFYLLGQRSQHPTGDDPTLQLLDTAINGPGIASSEGNEVVVVLSPHQNNFAMRLRVELWATQPPDDLDDWQEVFLTGLVVGEERLAYETPTMEGATIAVPSGRYAAQVAGRGFLNRDGPGRPRPATGGGYSCGRHRVRSRRVGYAPGRAGISQLLTSAGPDRPCDYRPLEI